MNTKVSMKDVELYNALLKHADVIEWQQIASEFNADQSSGIAINKAISLIPKNSENHIRFQNAVKQNIPGAKVIHHHWLVKALASVIEGGVSAETIIIASKVKKHIH